MTGRTDADLVLRILGDAHRRLTAVERAAAPSGPRAAWATVDDMTAEERLALLRQLEHEQTLNYTIDRKAS